MKKSMKKKCHGKGVESHVINTSYMLIYNMQGIIWYYVAFLSVLKKYNSSTDCHGKSLLSWKNLGI